MILEDFTGQCESVLVPGSIWDIRYDSNIFMVPSFCLSIFTPRYSSTSPSSLISNSVAISFIAFFHSFSSFATSMQSDIYNTSRIGMDPPWIVGKLASLIPCADVHSILAQPVSIHIYFSTASEHVFFVSFS